MKFSKEEQLKRAKTRKNKKQKEKSKISQQVYNYVRKRDKGRCVVCGSRNNLECHHIQSRSLMGDGKPENLVMLCKYHHYIKIHSMGDYETKKKIYEYMIKLGYDYEDDLRKLEFRHSQRM